MPTVRILLRITAIQSQIAARVDGVVDHGRKLAGREVDREPLRHGTEIELQRTRDGDRPPVEVDLEVAIAHVIARFDRQRRPLARSIMPVEAKRCHPCANRRIEGAVSFGRQRARELDRPKKHLADRRLGPDIGIEDDCTAER